MNSRRSFYVTEASSNKTFKNVLRSDNSDRFTHKESYLAPFRDISTKKYRNCSSLDRKGQDQMAFQRKKLNSENRNLSSSDIFNIKMNNVNNANDFTPNIKHKRFMNTIEKTNPQLKKEELNLKTLYEGNSSYTGKPSIKTTVSWNINTQSKNNRPNAAKAKFLKDILGKNPLKQVTFKEKIESDKEKRKRNYGKFLSVSSFLSSNELRKNLTFSNAGTMSDYKSNKITSAHYDSNQVQRLNSTEKRSLMKFAHVYDGNRGYYL